MIEIDGAQWVIKFFNGEPVDTPLVEHATMTLAARAGIAAATTRIVPLQGEHAIAVRRFDRADGQRIVESGERAQMSKRSGEFVTLDELVDEIGVDATRWFMLWRSHETTVDLDVELARRESSDNPVYYVQYAHARIASILRKADDAGAAAPDFRPASSGRS